MFSHVFRCWAECEYECVSQVFLRARINNSLCVCSPPGLLETGPREGVVAAEVGVVEEDGAWAEETALTPAESATSTDTAAATNREFESDLRV